MTAACTEGTQVGTNATNSQSSDTESVVSTSTPKKKFLLTEQEKAAADAVIFDLYAEKPAQDSDDDAIAVEGLHNLLHHAPIDDYAGRCVVVDGPSQVQELVNGVRIDFENPQWMIIVRLPDGRHAITKMMPEELVSTLQVILSRNVQALRNSEPHQLRLVMRGRQLDEDIQLQEAGLTNCSLIHLVLPHWGGGRSGKEFRAEREASIKTDSSPEASLNFPIDCISQVNTISAEVEGIAQEQGHYMENRSEKRKRDQTYDPDVTFEVTQPVSAILQNIMARARSNLAAASLETLQVVNLRLQASHAVEDAAVIYLKQMEAKQEADRRAMWLQTVRTETLETILDEWRFKAGLLKQPEQNTTGNTLRTDPNCPGQTSPNHKGDHPIVPAPGEMFVMTPTFALSWCEKDAVWDNEQDEYALCCTEEHRIQVEQEAVRWMSQYRIKLAPSITGGIQSQRRPSL